MKRSQLLITLLLFALLLVTGFTNRLPISYGAVPWPGWAALLCLVLFVGVGLVVLDTRRRGARIKQEQAIAEKAARAAAQAALDAAAKGNITQALNAVTTVYDPKLLDPNGPSYPHPVINVATCIGCHRCVDACPHDVLAIVNGKATPVAVEQCMEDTSCQAVCPTVPESCIVLNTNKKIEKAPVPKRDERFMTNVPGVYLIGDVSGTPLIKNAINEGGAVIDYIVEELRQTPSNDAADYDVAIVGVGPAGLSATALAHRHGLRYVAIEQDRVAGMIQEAYEMGKYVYFNPVDNPVKGGIDLPGPGDQKEVMIERWLETVRANQLVINEQESCQRIKPEGDAFLLETEQEQTRRKLQYRARRVVLAVGERGAPTQLKVPGKDLKLTVSLTETVLPAFCNKCGAPRAGDDKFCQSCGKPYLPKIKSLPPREDEKVQYKLSDADAYSGKHLVVVGAGNSAIEAAVSLAAYRDGNQLACDENKQIRWRDNVVSLVVRSNFKNDLKLSNKMLVWECIDEGRIKAYFEQTIKEITPDEVVLMSARERDTKTAKETARFKNDYVFALIGGEKPTKFLESIGIKIG